MTSHDEVRASAPRAPEASRALRRARAEHETHIQQRAKGERRSIVRGLLLLAMIFLIASMARAGFERVFVPGWWRHW